MDTVERWRVISRERAWTADVLESLTAGQWLGPTLCAGWSVRELAGHLAYGPRARVGDVLVQAFRARGNFDRMVDATARREAALPIGELVVRLRRTAQSQRLAPGQSLNNALLDILVHAQDLAVPLGIDRGMPAEAARIAADDTWRRAFPFHARRRLHGLRLVANDVPWTVGEGTEVEGPISALLLLLTGRGPAAVDHLTGPGVTRLKEEAFP